MRTKDNCAYISTIRAIIISLAVLSAGCFLNRMSAEATQITNVDTKMTKEERFAEVFQKAINVAERRLANYDPQKDPLKRSDLEDIIKILSKQKQVVLKQGVEVYEGQYGPMKHLIDLGEPVDSELSDVVYEIEIFYKKNYIALMTKEERFADMFQSAIELAEVRLAVYDTDPSPLTKEQLGELIQILSEGRQKVITGKVEPYEQGQYEYIKKLADREEARDSALSDAIREIEDFHRENY